MSPSSQKTNYLSLVIKLISDSYTALFEFNLIQEATQVMEPISGIGNSHFCETLALLLVTVAAPVPFA